MRGRRRGSWAHLVALRFRLLRPAAANPPTEEVGWKLLSAAGAAPRVLSPPQQQQQQHVDWGQF